MGIEFKGEMQPPELIKIECPTGISLEIMSDGSGSYMDALKAEQIILFYSDNTGVLKAENSSDFQLDLVVMMLKSRFNLPEDMSNKEVLTMSNGKPMTAHIFKKLFNLFCEELGITMNANV